MTLFFDILVTNKEESVLNKRIKELRKSLGMTQDDFGKKIGLARNSVANYEIGRRTPTNAVITSICREFNINENWLRTGEGEMKIEDCREERYSMNIAKFQRTDDETIIRWANAIAETNPEVLREIEKFMKKILEIEDD